jgi:hemoglobin-like flavoprotein
MIAAMEAPLFAIAEADIDIAPILFDRFFSVFPERKATFINPEASRGRMTNETIEAMIGLATNAQWVPTTIVNFVDLHQIYGDFPASLYNGWIDLLLDTLAEAAGSAWTAESDKAWRTQGERLKAMVAEAITVIS